MHSAQRINHSQPRRPHSLLLPLPRNRYRQLYPIVAVGMEGKTVLKQEMRVALGSVYGEGVGGGIAQ